MITDKKGFIEPVPKLINLVMAIIVLATGGLGLLVKFGIIGEIPSIPLLIMEIVTVIAGILLLIDGFIGSGEGMNPLMPKGLNIIIGIIVFASGVLLLLTRFKIIGVLPDVPIIVIQGLLLIGGVILLLDGIVGAKADST